MKLELLPKQKILLVDKSNYYHKIELFYESAILVINPADNFPTHPFLVASTITISLSRTYYQEFLTLKFSDSNGDFLYLPQYLISNFHIEILT